MEQTAGHMAKCGAEEGYPVVFDRRTGTEERRRGEGGTSGGSEHRQDGRKMLVRTL